MRHYTCRDVCGHIETYAPPGYALEGDPIGLHLGSYDREVQRLFLALELTPTVIGEALDFRPDMIFVHHTPFFSPLKELGEEDGHNRIILALIRREIALYTAHTNLDCVRGGVNDVLAELLGIGDAEILQPLNQNTSEAGLGRIGMLREPMSLASFSRTVAATLGNEGVRYCGSGDRELRRVACCGGAGAFLMAEAKARGADAYVTSDIKHHDGIRAEEIGLALVDAGHFATEAPVIPVLAARLAERMPNLVIAVSAKRADPFVSGGLGSGESNPCAQTGY